MANAQAIRCLQCPVASGLSDQIEAIRETLRLVTIAWTEGKRPQDMQHLATTAKRITCYHMQSIDGQCVECGAST